MRRSFCLTEQYQPRIDGGEMFTTVGGSSGQLGLVRTVRGWSEQLGVAHNNWG
jgi:hypothetical protein